MKGRLREVSLCVAAALGFGVVVTANAQVAQTNSAPAASAGADEELSEIVVTARRVEERAQDVPISMTVFNQQQLIDRNIVTAGDLAAYTPSMSVDNEFGQDVTSFSVRGFVQALNTTPSVAVYFADAVVPRGGNVGEPAGSGVAPGTFFDLQNLEVLKGPQGTLFGRNTDGGAVLVVPKKPTSDFEGYVEGSYGDYALGEVQAVLNVPLSDNVRVRFGVNHETRNGYMENISGIGPNDFNNVDYTAARLSVVADITPDIETYLIGTYNLSINNGPTPQLFACNPAGSLALLLGSNACPSQVARNQSSGPYATQNDLPGAESYLRQVGLIDTTTWHANDFLTVKNIANYGQLLTELDSALFGINYQYNGQPLYATMSNPSALGGLTTDQYTFSDELQLQGNALGNKLTWQGGGYIERSGPLGDVTGSRSANFLTCTDVATFQCSGPGLIDDNVATIHFTDLAIFAQATYSILDNLKLTGGGRYTSDKTTSSFGQTDYGGYSFTGGLPTGSPASITCSSALPGQTVATGCEQSFQQNSHAPTYMVDLDYTPIEDTMVYAKYARGYRQGGVATFVADGFHLYRPEFVNTYEIGEKTTFRGPIPGIFNVSAFYNNFSDQQLLAGFTGGLGVTPTSGIVNAGKSRIYGAEMESAITPFKQLTVGVSYTYLSTKLVSATQTALPPGNYTTVTYPSAVGGVLPYSPKNKLSANATYRLPTPEDLGQMSLGAIFTYTSGALVSVASPLASLEPYGLLNMNFTWNSIAGSSVDGELFASNITDRLYYNNVTQLYNTPFGTESRYPGEPRMYGVRVRVHFGK
jgi:iron complex outermembrane receptor protein